MNPPTTLFYARGAADDRGVMPGPVAALVRWGPRWPGAMLLAIGSPSEVEKRPEAVSCERVNLGDQLLLPALVNAHTHLDLTIEDEAPFPDGRGSDRRGECAAPGRPPDSGNTLRCVPGGSRSPASFALWLSQVREARGRTDDEIRRNVEQGAARSLAGGVAAVGDIAGAWSAVPLATLRESPLVGVSFLECFGLGDRADDSIRRLDRILSEQHGVFTGEQPSPVRTPSPTGRGSGRGAEQRSVKFTRRAHGSESRATEGGVRLGIQPHAPYSAGRRLYDHVCKLSRRFGISLSTHLAESHAERECIVSARGPIRDFLDSLGLWTVDAKREFRQATGAVLHLAGPLSQARWLAVHVNDCSDEAIEMLARTGTVVVYCPRASNAFSHENDFGPHRYRDMLAQGIPVALGTDSILTLPEHESDRLSTFDDMRFLWSRDRRDPISLLRMATTAGAAALGIDANLFRLTPGPIAGIASVAITPIAASFGDGRDVRSTSDPLSHQERSGEMAGAAPCQVHTQSTRLGEPCPHGGDSCAGSDPLVAALNGTGIPRLLAGGNHSCQTAMQTCAGARAVRGSDDARTISSRVNS